MVESAKPQDDASEEGKLMDDMAKVYVWWLKLITLFLDREGPPHILSKIYDEYRSRLIALNERRVTEVDKLEKWLSALADRLAHLQVRQKAGELSFEEYARLEQDIRREVKRLEPKLSILQDGYRRRKDVRDQLERNLRRLANSSAAYFGVEPDVLERMKRDVAAEVMEVIGQEIEGTSRLWDALRERYGRIKAELDRVQHYLNLAATAELSAVNRE